MKETAMARATDTLWWAGWRPLAVGSLGGVVGVLSGYANGAVGPATAAVGVVLISVSALSPLLRRTGFMGAVITSIIFYVVGPGRAQQALEESGVGSEWTEFVAEFILNVGSLVGVETAREPTAVVGGGVASLAVWSLGGAALGGVFWIAGVYVVNSGYSEVYHRFVDHVEEEGRSLLGEGDGFYTFSHGEETIPVVRSAKKYHATNLLVGDSSLSLHHDSTVDMVRREEDMSDSTKELYYDQVASVDYEAPYLKIRMSDGQVVRIVTSGKPVEVMEEIEEHLRRYKTSSETESSTEEGTVRDEGYAKGSEDNEKSKENETGTGEDETNEEGEIGEDIMEDVDEALNAFDEAMEDTDGEGSGDDILGAFDKAADESDTTDMEREEEG
jgi:hypothetical protein